MYNYSTFFHHWQTDVNTVALNVKVVTLKKQFTQLMKKKV